MKILLLSAALSAALAGGSALAEDAPKPICADRPNKAAATCTVDAGRWQVEVDVADWTHARSDGTTTDLALFGATNFKYGVNSRLDLELNLVPYETMRVGGSPQSGGFGDVTARAKLNLIPGDNGVSLLPFLKIPTASKALGNGAVEGGLVVPVGFTLPAGAALTINPEIDAFHDASASGTHAAYALSAAVSHALGPQFTGAVELWGARNDDPAGRLNQASFDLGLAWIPLKDQNLQLDAGANLGLTHDTPGVNFYVGVSRRF